MFLVYVFGEKKLYKNLLTLLQYAAIICSMKVVRFERYDTERQRVEPDGYAFLLDGDTQVQFEGLNETALEMAQKIMGSDGKFYTPSDGLKYLEQLKNEYHGSYCWATDVETIPEQ
jgi:hypothetical protein